MESMTVEIDLEKVTRKFAKKWKEEWETAPQRGRNAGDMWLVFEGFWGLYKEILEEYYKNLFYNS